MSLEEFKSLITTVSVLAGVGFTIFYQLRSKNSSAENKLSTTQLELIQTYEKQLELLKSQGILDKLEITNWNNKYAQLQGTLAEKEKSISLLTQLAQNRNPELEGYIKEGLEVNKQILNYLKTVTSGVNMNTKILEDHSMYEVKS